MVDIKIEQYFTNRFGYIKKIAIIDNKILIMVDNTHTLRWYDEVSIVGDTVVIKPYYYILYTYTRYNDEIREVENIIYNYFLLDKKVEFRLRDLLFNHN